LAIAVSDAEPRRDRNLDSAQHRSPAVLNRSAGVAHSPKLMQ
jgi:hypothetical protein